MYDNNVARSFALAALSLGVVVGGAQAQQPTLPAKTQNLKILLQAQGQYQSIIAGTHDEYSEMLLTLEGQLNAYAGRNRLDQYESIVVLDPLQADAGVALGLPHDMVTKTLLLQKNVPAYPLFTTMLNNMMFISTSLPTNSVLQTTTYTQAPHALYFVPEAGEKSPCVIVPAPENTIPASNMIAGLSLAETADFLNGHEGWHCLDSVYYPRQFSPAAYGSFNPSKLETLLANPAGLKAYSAEHKKEVFADVAKLGENIRGGKDPEQIDLVAAWRRNQHDLMHNSAPVLEEFKKAIMAMGLENFRAFNEQQARKFYYAVVEKNALDPARLETVIAYDYGSEKVRADFRRRAAGDAGIARDLAFRVAPKTGGTQAEQLFGGIFSAAAVPAQNEILVDKLTKWPALDMLEKEAAESGQGIYPASLTEAYARMQTKLETLQRQDSQNADLYIAQASKLKDVYIKISDLDFAALNNRPRDVLLASP